MQNVQREIQRTQRERDGSGSCHSPSPAVYGQLTFYTTLFALCCILLKSQSPATTLNGKAPDQLTIIIPVVSFKPSLLHDYTVLSRVVAKRVVDLQFVQPV